MKSFAKLHPITKSTFFICAFVLMLTANNPVFSAVSLCCALVYLAVSKSGALFASVKFSAVIILFVGVFNMLFAHYGETVMFTAGELEFTFQALFYGINQGFVMAAVMLWFRILSFESDSSDVGYIFRFAPKTALLFSMVLGFLPRFTKKLSDIRDAQKGLCSNKNKSLKARFKTAVANFSALVTYSLESSIITADSMTSRGYNQKAVSPSRYRITARDIAFFVLIICAFAFLLWAKIVGLYRFVFEPRTYFKADSPVANAAFLILMLLPSLIEIREMLLWKRASSNV